MYGSLYSWFLKTNTRVWIEDDGQIYFEDDGDEGSGHISGWWTDEIVFLRLWAVNRDEQAGYET
jgi:hypothetical protein